MACLLGIWEQKNKDEYMFCHMKSSDVKSPLMLLEKEQSKRGTRTENKDHFSKGKQRKD